MAAVATPRAATPALEVPRVVLVGGGLFLAFLAGALIGRSAPFGFAAALALVYAPLAMLNPAVGIAVWIGIAHIARLEFVSVGPTAATLLIIAGWVGTIGARRGLMSAWTGQTRWLPVLGGLLVAWFFLSALWARDSIAALDKAWEQTIALTIFVVVASVLRTRGQIQLALLGFVAGATLSVAIGLVDNGLAGASSAYDTATSTEGRLQGGAGDPNFLAAGVVPALVFAIGLIAVMRDPAIRLALVTAIAILAVGLFATQSRGGFLALIAAVGAALLVMRGRRALIVAGVLVVAAIGTAWLAANPAAIERLTSTDKGGNGRSELWTVASRMGIDRPLTGVGLNNFRVYSRDYTRDVGTLRFVRLIAERPHVVHNSYLQTFAETGVLGLLLLVGLIGAIGRTLRMASHRLRAAGDRAGTILCDCAFVAVVSNVVTSGFLSNGSDWRMWFVFALAPPFWLLARQAAGGARG